MANSSDKGSHSNLHVILFDSRAGVMVSELLRLNVGSLTLLESDQPNAMALKVGLLCIKNEGIH